MKGFEATRTRQWYCEHGRLKTAVLPGLLFCICFFVLLTASLVNANEEYVEGKLFYSDKTISWDFPYSDDFFLKPSDQYDLDFARLSLGLAAAAFRDEEHPDTQDSYLIEFLNNLGFSQIESETYRTDPTVDSIAYGLASKKIGDMTVLVCGVCGGGYGLEWASNLTVGDEKRSAGFQEASLKVQAAIDDYMNRYVRDEKVKLWIAGYSRAAAVANITAADFTASGRFEDVYAYTFATPRTTRKPIAYPNIFNMILKEDLVPKVPCADWGYERFGNDLFFVSPETDSNCSEIIDNAKKVYRDTFSAEMVSNTEIDSQLRTLFDYLSTVMPTSASYMKNLQPFIIDIMTEKEGLEDALQVLFLALQKYVAKEPETGEELVAMQDYLASLINTYYLPGSVEKLPADQWDPQLGTLNLFYAHLIPKYFSMLYASDDPEVLFSENTEYIRLIIYGDVDLSISDGSTVLREVSADGTETENAEPAMTVFPYVNRYEGKTVVTLPADQSYEVAVTSRPVLPQTISYTGLLLSGHTLRAQKDNLYSYIMNKGDTAVIRTAADGKVIDPEASDYMDISALTEAIYSPTSAMRMENNRIVHLNISGFADNVLRLIVVLLVQTIVSVILLIRRKKKNLKRNPVVTFIWHCIMAAVFAVLEIGMWYFVSAFLLLKAVMSALVFLVIFFYAWKGYHEENRNGKAFWSVIAALAVFVILQNLLIGSYTRTKGILLLVVYLVFMNAVFVLLWLKKRQRA